MLSSIEQVCGHSRALATGAGGSCINTSCRELDSISANLTEFLWLWSSQRTPVLPSWEVSLSACWEVYLDNSQGKGTTRPSPEAASCHGFCLTHQLKGMPGRQGAVGEQETGPGLTQPSAGWPAQDLSRPQFPSLIPGCLRTLTIQDLCDSARKRNYHFSWRLGQGGGFMLLANDQVCSRKV